MVEPLTLAIIGIITAVSGIAWLASEIPDAPEDPGATVNKSSAVEPLPVIYGLRKIAGTRVFLASGGPDNKYLWLAVALCEGEIEAVEQVWLDGKPISSYDSVFASGHSASAAGGDRLAVVHWYRGTDVQTSSALLQAAPGWTANHRLRGVAYLACRFRYSRDVFRGVPRVEALVRGRRLADPRDAGAAAAWSDNAALVILDYLRHPRYGKGLADSAIDLDAFEAAANDVDGAETYMARTSLGRPAAVVGLPGGRQRLVWHGSAPPGLAAAGRIHDAAAGGAKAARVLSVDRVTEETEFSGENWDEPGERWRWHHIAQDLARTEIVIDLEGGAAFVQADTVWMSAAGRYEINAIVDTGKPLIENLRVLLSGCRGMLPWISGKYTLVIERDRPPVMDIGPDQIVAGIDAQGPSKRDTLNQATARYTEPARQWKQDSAIWPPPGGATDKALLALDRGERLSRGLNMPTVTSRAQALDLSRIVVYRTRGAVRARLRATPECIVVTPADIVRLTDATLGWNDKPFLVLGVAHQYGGEVALECVEHNASVYTWEDADPALLHDDTDHPNPLIVPAVAGLAAETVLDRVPESDGSSASIQTLIGATVRWSAAADAAVRETVVAYRPAPPAGADDTGEGWRYALAPAGAAHIDVLPLRKSVTWQFRAAHRNPYGAEGPWSDIVELLVDKDITAPGPPTEIQMVPGPGLLEIRWVNPVDVGFSHVEGRLERLDAEGAVVESIGGEHYGTSAALGGLPADTRYRLTLRSVDDAGNRSADAAPVEATTLGVGAGTPGLPGKDGKDAFPPEFAFTRTASGDPPENIATSPVERMTDGYIPGGWTRSKLIPTKTQNVYASERQVRYSVDDGFEGAGEWFGVTIDAGKTG